MTESPDPNRPYADFGGTVGRTFAGSESWWPDRPTTPTDAPNVIVMLADDLGYSDLGCYGSELATPHLDALAGRGLRYTNFHSTPMCSPTRASLLTGINSHAVGVGHVCHSDPGFPGYAMELSGRADTMAELFGANGYSTFMVGKWHLAKDSDLGDDSPRTAWPCQKGFDSYYGILDGFTNFHQPHRLVRDNTAVSVDRYPDDYYLTDDLTDEAIRRIRATKAADPTRPFFCYFAHAAVHAPLHAPAADIARHVDRYVDGWDQLRLERLARLVGLGIIDPETELPPPNSEAGNEVAEWATLDPDAKELFARYMAVYAAMVENIDTNFGRLVAALESLGELDNTIIIFTSDNGASREGEEWGTTSYYTHLLSEEQWRADHERLDLVGGPQTMPHVPMGWAMASNTPFRLYKINTHAGGHQVPCIVSWPKRLDGRNELRSQYTHVTDVLPTLVELCRLDHRPDRVGPPAMEMTGSSFAGTLTDPEQPTEHREQYYEMVGHRGYYRDGWSLVTLHQPMTPFGDHEWELYDLRNDPTECHDLASVHPEKVRELAAAWETAAWANQVYPLESGSMLKHVLRPPGTAERYDTPVTLGPGTPTLERWRSQRLIWGRPFRVEVDCTVEPGDEGILLAHGDQGGGYSLLVVDGRLRFTFNPGHGPERHDAGMLDTGPRRIVLDATAAGNGAWEFAVSVDGTETVRAGPYPYFIAMAPFEGIDIGLDRRSPVDWDVYEAHGPFPWSGALHTVTYAPGPPASDSPAAMEAVLRELGLRFE